MSEEESGFNVVDKRKIKDDAAEAPAAEPADTSEEQTDVEDQTEVNEQGSAEPGRLPHLSVMDRMLMCIDILHQGAWVALGLVADPATGEVEKDLESARAAIDGVAFLAEKIEPSLDENTRREVKRVVNDLQINFVRQSQK